MGNVTAVYIIGLMTVGHSRPDSDTPGAALAWILCLGASLVGLGFGKRPGAGGSARALLRPVARTLTILTGVIGFLLLALGYGGAF